MNRTMSKPENCLEKTPMKKLRSPPGKDDEQHNNPNHLASKIFHRLPLHQAVQGLRYLHQQRQSTHLNSMTHNDDGEMTNERPTLELRSYMRTNVEGEKRKPGPKEEELLNCKLQDGIQLASRYC